MHNQIMPPAPGTENDHEDHNGCNNQRYNLRSSTKAQNQWNGRVRRDNKSGFRGVNFHAATGKWIARIQENGKRIKLGEFATKEEAGAAYKIEADKRRGEFAVVKIAEVPTPEAARKSNKGMKNRYRPRKNKDFMELLDSLEGKVK
jgi:hypothetical protein